MKRYVLALSLTAAAVGLLYAKVSVDYDHSADFGKYHSYSWLNVKAGNQLWADRIQNDIDEQLTAKGWSKVESGGDASVGAFGSTKNQPTLQTFYDGLGGGWGWRGWGGGTGMATTTVENTPVGTLVVDLFDSPTKKLIWRSVSTETLSDNPDKNEHKLEKAVEEMFKKFPPAPKG